MGAAVHKAPCSPSRITLEFQDFTPTREIGNVRRQLDVDPRSPTDEIIRTPIIVDQTPSALDPRSPTVGIDRTPLMFVLNKGTVPDFLMEGVSTAGNAAPICKLEACEDVDMATPQKAASSPDPDLISGWLPSIDCMALVEPTPLQTKLVSVPKQLFPEAQHRVQAKPALGLRSPFALTTLDTNSPRSIVQSKQRQNITKNLGVVKGRNFIVDKENLAQQ